jgi:hypothetical protein
MRDGERMVLKTGKLLSNSSLLHIYGIISGAYSVSPGESQSYKRNCCAAGNLFGKHKMLVEKYRRKIT